MKLDFRLRLFNNVTDLIESLWFDDTLTKEQRAALAKARDIVNEVKWISYPLGKRMSEEVK